MRKAADALKRAALLAKATEWIEREWNFASGALRDAG